MEHKQIFLTKDDKADLIMKLSRAIFFASLLNFFAIVSSSNKFFKSLF